MSVASPLQHSPLTAEESLSINGVLQEEPRSVSSSAVVVAALGVSGDKPCGGEIKAPMDEEVLAGEVEDCTTVTTVFCSASTVSTTATCTTSPNSSASSSGTALTSSTANNPILSPQQIKWNSSGGAGVEADNYLGIQMPGSTNSMGIAEDKVSPRNLLSYTGQLHWIDKTIKGLFCCVQQVLRVPPTPVEAVSTANSIVSNQEESKAAKYQPATPSPSQFPPAASGGGSPATKVF